MTDAYKTYSNHRVEPYFSQVKNGEKTIEGRLKKGWYCNVKPGDHVIVNKQDDTDSIEVVVKAVREYRTLNDMLENEPLERILPGIQTIEEGMKVYNQFYSEELQNSHGFIALEVERVR